jgi:hypothetical protein
MHALFRGVKSKFKKSTISTDLLIDDVELLHAVNREDACSV